MLTCAPHPSYPGHCKCRNGMSDSLGVDKIVGYLDLHVDRLIVIIKSRAIPVHQEVALSGKGMVCWE